MAQMKNLAGLTPNFGWCKLESSVGGLPRRAAPAYIEAP
jgi:hypothetical protein